MSEIWDQARLERYITEGIEESLTLDYKAAASLDKSDKKKIEITKDVSAMANSAGGILIYGIAEFQDKAHEHLPEKLDPVDRTAFSKEWLEHIIGNIQPRIDGVIIHPVSINSAPNHVIYVAEIPQSHTAHQARDMRYYKRFNFESVMMSDYEIRDVMNRNKHPAIAPTFKIFLEDEAETSYSTPAFPYGVSTPSITYVTKINLVVFAINEGKVFANYVNINLQVPNELVYQDEVGDELLEELFGIMPPMKESFQTYLWENTERDVTDVKPNIDSISYKYGPSRYVPILPKRYFTWDLRLNPEFLNMELKDLFIEWEIYADNAPVLTDRIAICDIQIVDKRSKAE